MERKFESREMKVEDLKECSKLFLKVFTKEPWFDQWKSVKTVEIYLAELVNNPVFLGFVIEEKDKIVGVSFGHTRSWYDGYEYCIDEFLIDDGIQGVGLGTQFMKSIKDGVKAKDINCIFLLTERGIPAEVFYKKNGFRIKENSLFMYSLF